MTATEAVVEKVENALGVGQQQQQPRTFRLHPPLLFSHPLAQPIWLS